MRQVPPNRGGTTTYNLHGYYLMKSEFILQVQLRQNVTPCEVSVAELVAPELMTTVFNVAIFVA